MKTLRLMPLALMLLAALAVQGAITTGDSALLVVKNTTQRMLSALENKHESIKEDPTQIYALVDKIILPHFDFSRMSRWVLGKHWRSASEAQRQRFIEQFRTLLVRTYATALSEYSGQEVDFLPVRADADATDVTVRTTVKQPGGFPIPINYSMHLEEGTWKVYDVTIDGVSLVANYRNAFSSQIRRVGLDNLIGMLAERNGRTGR